MRIATVAPHTYARPTGPQATESGDRRSTPPLTFFLSQAGAAAHACAPPRIINIIFLLSLALARFTSRVSVPRRRSTHPFAAPPLPNPSAYAASPSPSSAPLMRTLGVAAAAAAAMSTVHATSVTNSGAAAHTWTNSGGGGGGGHGAAQALTNSGRDVSLVLLVVACTLLVVTIVLLIVGVRLLKRLAATVAAAEGARGQDILSNDLRAGEAAARISVGIDDDDEPALHNDNGDSRTQLVEYADEREPLLRHVRGHGGGAGRHCRSASRQHQQPGRRTTLAVFDALNILLGVSSTPPTADASSHGGTAAPRRRSRSCQTGSSAVPTSESQPAWRGPPQQQRQAGHRAGPDALAADESTRDAFRAGRRSTWHSNDSLSQSGAARKCDESAVAPASASPEPASLPAAAPGSSAAHAGAEKPNERKAAAPATADYGGTPPSDNAQLPAFTATTEKDMVVYNTTHNSRYRLLQRIGMGAFSSVYLVQHKTTGKQYALKYILCKGDRERLAALRECEVIYSLQGHPQVIRIVDMFMSYQFQRASPSPTVAGSPTAVTTNSACKEQASGQQGLPSFPGVPPSAPAATAAALAPSAIAKPALAPASAAPASTNTVSVAGRLKGLNDAAMTKAAMDSSSESRAAAHGEDDDDHVDDSCVDTHRYSEGRRRGSCPRVRPSVEGVACAAYMANADHVSDVENEESAYSEHQQPQQQGKQSMRAPSGCCPRPLPYSVQHTSQSSSSVNPPLSAAAAASTAPATASSSYALAGSSCVPAQLGAAAGGGAQGCGHVPLQSAHHASAAALTTASAARAAATGAFSPPRDEAHADQPHLCCHATNVPDAVAHDESDATATSMHPCFPSTTRNATRSRSSEASQEPGTLEDYDGGNGVHSGSNSRRRAEQGQGATVERAKPAVPSRRASSEDRGSDGAVDGHADIDAGGEERRTELRGDADADEKRSCKGSDARSGATSSSGADEEPIQPIRRIFVPPPYVHPPLNGMAAAPRSCSICSNNIVSYAGTGNGAASVLQPQNRTYATGEGSPTAHHLYSVFPTAAAGGALAVVAPATANCGAAPTPVRRIPERPDVGSLPATASPPPFAAASASLTSSSPSPSAAANLRHAAGSLVTTSTLPHHQQQQHPQPAPSSVTSYAPARAAVSSADVKSAATGAPAVQAPIRYKDFVLSPTTVTAHAAASWAPVPATQENALVHGQAHRQPADRGGSPAPPPCAAAARAGSGAAGAGAIGLTADRPTGESVNPYLERARGREPVPPPRTSYAPGGGVRYNSLAVPYVAAPTTLPAATKGLPVQSSSPSSSLTLSASGTGVSAFDERKAGAGQGWRFDVTGAGSSSQDSDASLPASQAARVTASRSLPSTAPAVATVVRNTYAPLRHGNVVQSNAASPATSSMASSSLVPPPSPSLQKQLPQPPSVACPAAAAPAAASDRLSVFGVLRTARAGQQGEREDWDEGKPRVSASWPAKDAVLVPTQAPPLLPLPGLANQASGVYFLPSVGRVNVAGAVPRAATPRAPYGEGRPPAAAAAQDEAPSPTKPLYTNLGVLLAGPSMTADPATATTTHLLRTGVQPSSPRHPQSNSYAGGDADRKRQRGYGSVGLTGAAPSPVRYTNAGNPNLWNAYNAGASPASAAAVAALTGLSPRIGAKTPTAAGAGESDTNDGKSSKTTHTNSSSSTLQDACDTGYLCLVMEHHPMGDLCRYALRAQHELETRRHRQQQSESQALARRSLMSMGIWQPIASQNRTCTSERSSVQQPQAPAKNATERDGGGSGAEAGEPVSPLSLRPLSLTHGGAAGSAAAASSLLAAAADATWTVKVAMSRTDLHPALSAGVGGRGNTSGSHTDGGTDGDERASDFDAQRAASVAVDPTSDKPLTEAQLLSIAYQLASVLDHMHQQNPPIVHRDLKPENILIKGALIDYLDLPLSAVLVSTSSTARCGGKDDALDKSSVSSMTPPFTTPAAVIDAAASSVASLPPIRITRAVVPIVLIDFGLAILQDSHGRSHGSRGGGTRPYIAPESWKGGTCTASDVWSLGCVLYALATCRLVAGDVRIMSQEAKRDGFASRMLKDIIAHKYSLAFASFVVSLLVVDPAKRPTAAQAARCFCVADGDICFDLSSPFFSNVLDL